MYVEVKNILGAPGVHMLRVYLGYIVKSEAAGSQAPTLFNF